ncbi:MAG: hypothetical protein AAFZ91_00660 [Pseudomonadota bacterium]
MSDFVKSVELVTGILGERPGYALTDIGVRVPTDCTYPNFDTVHVFVQSLGQSSFIVSDAGESWVRLSDFRDAPLKSDESHFKKVARLYGVDFSSNQPRGVFKEPSKLKPSQAFGDEQGPKVISAVARSADWLKSAILSVANAASSSLSGLQRENTTSGADFEDLIYEALYQKFYQYRVEKQVEVSGGTGKSYRYDFAIQMRDRSVFINAVSKHGASINAAYRVFADTPGIATPNKIAMFQKQLDAPDVALLQSVSTPVNFSNWQNSRDQVFV